MKKLRALKDMPNIEVGTEFLLKGDSLLIKLNGITFVVSDLDKLVDQGWFEWVEEPKTLRDKFNDICGSGTDCDYCIKMSQIAKEHTLEVFDKARKDAIFETPNFSERLNYIRNAIEKDGEE